MYMGSFHWLNSTRLFNYMNENNIDINFLDSEFSDDKLLDEALDFLFEILLNPNVKDNKFDKKSFDKIYDRLDLVINSMKENTTKYALSRSIELMDETDPASFNLWGYKEDLDKINVSNLYEYYKYVIKNNKIWPVILNPPSVIEYFIFV